MNMNVEAKGKFQFEEEKEKDRHQNISTKPFNSGAFGFNFGGDGTANSPFVKLALQPPQPQSFKAFSNATTSSANSTVTSKDENLNEHNKLTLESKLKLKSNTVLQPAFLWYSMKITNQ